jgi:large subunit ribosomal protein L9
MQVILLERVENLGHMGDVVNVKPGYARNFLLPRQKALRATDSNIAYFEAQKKVLEAENLKKREEAEKVGKKLSGLKAAIIRQASEAGQLYGSVSARDIADAIVGKGFKIDKNQVRMDQAYKILGLYPVKITLHPEVVVEITINIARSAEEAKIQEERGEALITRRDEEKLVEQPVEAAPEGVSAEAQPEETAA